MSLTMHRSQVQDVTAGHSRGCWAVPQLGVALIRHPRRRSWLIAALFTFDKGTDERASWLKEVGLASAEFVTRREALQALQAAVAVDPPAFLNLDPCSACQGTRWVQYDDHHAIVCAACCAHDQGWYVHSQLDRGELCCRCGTPRTETDR